MCWLAETYPDKAERMIREAHAKTKYYLFAAACINISAMLVLLLGLNDRPGMSPVRSMPCPANGIVRKKFASVLAARLAAGRRRPFRTCGGFLGIVVPLMGRGTMC